MTVPTRPRVFVSSTIYDFADLRQALNFWLEEVGFDVQMSEYNDFERRPEAGTFEACFESIRESDYYLLLIGMRRGAWYDEPSCVSVTQQEYRVAYDSLVRTGRPKVVVFVRHDVLVVLEERQRSGVVSESESTLQDSAFTAGFLREVRREEETQRAVTGQGPFPAANWLTEFATFRELTDGLKSSLRIRGPLQKVALLENLRHELERNLRMTMTSFKGKPFYHHFWLDRLRGEVRIERQYQLVDKLWLGFDQIKRLFIYTHTGPAAPERFVRSALNEAILSGALLAWDIDQGSFVPSPLLDALYRLRAEFDGYAAIYRKVQEEQFEILKLWEQVRSDKQGGYVPAFRVIWVYSLHDIEQNVVRLLVAILRYLYRHTDSVDVMFRPISPIEGEDERIKAEHVSEEEMHAWLANDNMWLRVGTVDMADDQRREMEETRRKVEEILGKDRLDEILQGIVEGDEELTPQKGGEEQRSEG